MLFGRRDIPVYSSVVHWIPKPGRSRVAVIIACAVAGGTLGASAGPAFRLPQTGTPASAPQSRPAATQPAGPRPFQPGVSIDWQQREVRADGVVVLREGPLEYVACFRGKEHESIVRLTAAAAHIAMALGLIGLTPGHPPRWEETQQRYAPPAGDLVDVAFEWQDEAGRTQTAPAFAWLREVEYARAAIDRPWVFAGSRRMEDGSLAADRSGSGLAIVDDGDCLLALTRSHTSRNEELWALADAAAIPSLRTRVTLVLRAARPRSYAVAVDFRGTARVDGRYVADEDLADLIGLALRLDPAYVQKITCENSLRSDVAAVQRRLLLAGVPAAALHWGADTPTGGPQSAP